MLAGQQNWIENYFSKDIIATNRFGQNRKIGSLRKFITARKRSLGQGNVFTPISDSVHGEGVSLTETPHGQRPPVDRNPLPGQGPLWTETPLYRAPWTETPCTETPAQIPLDRDSLHADPPAQSPLDRDPLDKTPLRQRSYWNAFLFKIVATLHNQGNNLQSNRRIVLLNI